jgi:flagellar motility protein MotE (MotC chaperone)
MALGVAAVLMACCPVFAQDRRAPDKEKPKVAANKTPEKAAVDKPPDAEASRFCANAAPSISEARIAWETKQLSELDAQVKQRLADLEKAEASVREWVAKRDTSLKAARGELVAISAKTQPGAAGAILNEMEAERASKLAVVLSGTASGEKKS